MPTKLFHNKYLFDSCCKSVEPKIFFTNKELHSLVLLQLMFSKIYFNQALIKLQCTTNVLLLMLRVLDNQGQGNSKDILFFKISLSLVNQLLSIDYLRFFNKK